MILKGNVNMDSGTPSYQDDEKEAPFLGKCIGQQMV